MFRMTLLTIARSGEADTGMQRLALSDDDKHVRDWFVETTKALGCEVTIDEMGNIFAVRPGKRKNVPAIFVGSHLDTQPRGGRYDGVLGVTCGIEMLKILEENGIETEGGVGVVNWTKYATIVAYNRAPSMLIYTKPVRKVHDSQSA